MAKPQFENVHAHWATLVESFQMSSLEFYRSVEAALQQRNVPEIRFSRVDYAESGVVSAKREYLRVERRRLHFDICAAPFGTGFFFSWWQVRPPYRFGLFFGLLLLILEGFVARSAFRYLARHDPMRYLLPFWWKIAAAVFFAFLAFVILCILARLGLQFLDDFLMPIPIAGHFYRAFFRPVTYYELDTEAMYRTSVHGAVLEVIDGLTKAKGLRALAEGERKPIMRELWNQ